MEKQSEVLQLVERLEDSQSRDCCSQRTEAATELRRLHAENERLRIELQAAQGNEQTLAFALLAARRNI